MCFRAVILLYNSLYIVDTIGCSSVSVLSKSFNRGRWAATVRLQQLHWIRCFNSRRDVSIVSCAGSLSYLRNDAVISSVILYKCLLQTSGRKPHRTWTTTAANLDGRTRSIQARACIADRLGCGRTATS